MVDPNSFNDSTSLKARWKTRLNIQDIPVHVNDLQKELGMITVTHGVEHNIQVVHNHVSILLTGPNSTVFGASIPSLSEYQLGFKGNPLFVVDLVAGFDENVDQVLHQVLQQGGTIQSCAELLWPATVSSAV